MKTIFGAIALTLAVPAFAQTAPAADPHARHQGMDHSQHGPTKHDCKECCEKMKGTDKKAEAKPASAGAGAHHGHGGHAD